MFQILRNAWKITDLRKKILFTVFILLIFRVGSAITVPFVDTAVLKNAPMDMIRAGYGDIIGKYSCLFRGCHGLFRRFRAAGAQSHDHHQRQHQCQGLSHSCFLLHLTF